MATMRPTYYTNNLLNEVLATDGIHDKVKATIVHIYTYLYIRQTNVVTNSTGKKVVGIIINAKDFASSVYGSYRNPNDKTKLEKCYYEAIDILMSKKIVHLAAFGLTCAYKPNRMSKRYAIKKSIFNSSEILDVIPHKINKFLKKLQNPSENLYHDSETFATLVAKLKNSTSMSAQERYQRLSKTVSRSEANRLNAIKILSPDILHMFEQSTLHSDKIGEVNYYALVESVTTDIQSIESESKTLNLCARTKEIIQDVLMRDFNASDFYTWLETLTEADSKQAHLSLSMLYNTVVSRKHDGGRLFSSFTNLKRTIRDKHFNYRWSIDVANSQFVLLSLLIKKSLLKTDETTEKFFELCAKGELYEYLSKKFGIDRHNVKIEMFKIIFNPRIHCFRSNLSGFFKKFQELFPQVMEWVLNYSYTFRYSINLATALQIQEANIFIDTVLAKYVSSNKVLTIHDSIYCFDDYLNKDEVLNTIIEAYNSQGMDVTLHLTEKGKEEINIFSGDVIQKSTLMAA